MVKRSRKGGKVRRSKRIASRRRRGIPRGPRNKGSDVHHFKQVVNGGTIFMPSGGSVLNTTGAFVMRLSDFPAYTTLGGCFEFCRLNKCTIEFLPKANMQLNSITVATGVIATASASGTFVTAIDQVPIYGTGAAGAYVVATSWQADTSATATFCSAVASGMTTNYIRGIPGAKEQELYKRRKIKFYPAFYDYVMAGSAPGAITGTDNPIDTFSNNGCCERKIKKWVNIRATAGVNNSGQVNGPLYFGPVYALDVNVNDPTVSLPLFDVRLTYSMSFKRIVGIE